MLALRIQELPDDIIDIIYSKVIFKQPKNLLDQIIKFGQNREYLYYLYRSDNDILLECLYDLCVIFILIKEDITPCSCDPEQLSDSNIIELESIIDNTYDYDCVFDPKIAYAIIYNIIMNIDNYYVEKIIEPYISVIKFNELNDLGYLTYNGI